MIAASKPKPMVFLDMDGVIADYLGAVHKLMGEPKRLWKGHEIHYAYYLDEDYFVKQLNEEDGFWDKMKPTPAAALIVQLLLVHTDLYIVSDPKHCYDWNAKVRWMAKNFNIKESRIILTPHKHLLAAPGRLLIDDFLFNTKKWTDHGGIAHWWDVEGNDIEQLNKLAERIKSL